MDLPGLSPFTEAQSGLFFGRESELEQLLGLLEASRTGAPRWVQIEGPCGVGKTSLVHAGLLPRLKALSTPEGDRWRVVSARPSPLIELLDAPVEEQAPEGTCVLVVLEEWEELVLLAGSQRRWLDERLSTALTREGSRLRLLTTMREDALPLLEQLPRLARLLNGAARYVLRPLEGDTLTRVVRELAGHSGLTLADGLPERMVREAMNEGHALSLLALVLRRFQAEQGREVLTRERYEALGGVGRVLAPRAEKLLADLSPAGLERARGMVLSLVQVHRGGPATRRSRGEREVLVAAGGDALAESVLRHLSGQRAEQEETGAPFPLLRVSDGPEPGDPRVTLLHDAVLQQVPTLVRWLDAERTRLERLADLDGVAHAWEQAGRPRSGLATGALLRRYRESARAPNEHTVRFLEAARRFEHQRLALGLALALGLLFTTSWALWAQRFAGLQQEQLIEATRAFVSEADGRLDRRAYTLEPRRALLSRFSELLGALPPSRQESLPGLRARIAMLHRRADLAFHGESIASTARLLDEAEKALQRGLEDHPDDRGLLLDAGMNAFKRGKRAQALGKFEDTRGLFARALKQFEQIPLGKKPEDVYRMSALSQAELAGLNALDAHPLQALEGYAQAMKLLERNLLEGSASDLPLLLEARGAHAEATARAGNAAKAAELFDAALKEALELTRTDPGDISYQLMRTHLLLRAAGFRAARGEHDEAVKHYQEALALARALRTGEPLDKRYGLALAEGLLGLERLRSHAADGTAVPALREERCGMAKEFRRQDPEDPRFRTIACE